MNKSILTLIPNPNLPEIIGENVGFHAAAENIQEKKKDS